MFLLVVVRLCCRLYLVVTATDIAAAAIANVAALFGIVFVVFSSSGFLLYHRRSRK